MGSMCRVSVGPGPGERPEQGALLGWSFGTQLRRTAESVCLVFGWPWPWPERYLPGVHINVCKSYIKLL